MLLEQKIEMSLSLLAEKRSSSHDEAKVALVAGDELGKELARILQDKIQAEEIQLGQSVIFPAMYRIADEAYKMYMEYKAPESFPEDCENAVTSIIQYSKEVGFLHRLKEVLEREKNAT